MPLSAPTLVVLGNILDAESKLLLLRGQADDFTKRPWVVKFTADQADLNSAFLDALAKFKELQAVFDSGLEIKADDLGAQATMARIAVEYEALKKLMNQGLTTGLSDNQILRAIADVATLAAKVDNLKNSLEDATHEAEIAAPIFARTFGAGGGFWGLGGHVNLFGGQGGGNPLPSFMTQIAGWHLALDAGIEVLAIWVPALIALGVAAAGAAPVVMDLYKQLSNVNTVAQATGDKVGFMNGAVSGAVGPYQALQNAMKPGIIEIFGAALDTVGHKSGIIDETALAVEHLFDRWSAMADLSLKSGTGNGLLQSGVVDIERLGSAFTALFGDAGDVVKEMPHVATVLIDVATGALRIGGDVLGASGGLLKFALALHGAIIWGGLLATVLIRLWQSALEPLAVAIAGKLVPAFALIKAGDFENLFGAMGDGIDAMLTPLSISVGLIAALAAVWYAADKQATAYNTTLEQGVAKSSIAGLGSLLKQDQALAAAQQLAYRPAGAQQTSILGAIGSIYNAVSGGGGVGMYENSRTLAGEAQFGQQYVAETQNLNALSKAFGGTASAESLASAAGITNQQLTTRGAANYALMVQMIQNYITGLKGMGQTTGMIGNDLAVMNKQGTDQYTAMQKLNSAWDQQTTDVTAAANAFDTYQQGLTTLASSSDTLHLKLGNLETTVAQGHAAIDGMTTADIALNQAFQSQITNANAVFDSLRSAGIGGNQFKAAVGATIAPLEKYAAGSKSATAELVALAEEAGYGGPNSLKALNQYLGITAHTGMAALIQASRQATINQSLLEGAMQATGNFMANQYKADLDKAELGYDGLGKAMQTYAQYQVRGTTDSKAGQKALMTVVTALESANEQGGKANATILQVISSILKIPKAKLVTITVQAALTGNPAAIAALEGSHLGSIINDRGSYHQGATGFLVPRGHPTDTYPALLQSDEAVVPRRLTPYVAPFLKAHGVPGFASGYVPPSMHSYTGFGGGDTHWHVNVQGDSDPHGAAKKIVQIVRSYKTSTGNQATGIG